MRRSLPGLLCVLLASLASVLLACGDRSGAGEERPPSSKGDPPGTPGAAGTYAPAGPGTGEAADPAAGAPAVAGSEAWIQRRPRISILVVGNQRGRFAPAACAADRRGGLLRLAVLADLCRRRAGEGFAALSVGWSLSDTGEEQAEAKAALYRAAVEEMGFSALLLGTTDLGVQALAWPFLDGRACALPAPPANAPVSRGGPLGGAADTDPIAAFQVREHEVRALSILDPEQGARLGGIVETVLPPAGALQLLTPHPDDLWLVATDATGSTIEELREAMRRLGRAVIVDLAGGGGVGLLEDVSLDGGPYVVGLGPLGCEAGVLDLTAPEAAPGEGGGALRLSWHVVPLDAGLDGLPSAARDHLAALLATYRAQVRSGGYLERFGTYPAPGDVTYVGSSRCARCHPGIYEDWRRTAHARALDTLVPTGDAWDPECVRCHAVGFQRLTDGRWGRLAGGFQDLERTPHLGGVGCESCHGPGSAHVARPEDPSVFGPQGGNRRHPGQAGCAACHDRENSHRFAERYAAEALPRVDHRGVPSDRRTLPPSR